jgi:AcrR family transcriptional regulator
VIHEPGLRERKKERTRQLIADTARELFAERGFDGVTVAEVARAAEVSEATVFNYFPRKEDLFYSRLEEFEEELLSAIRDRQPGETILEAFRQFVLQPRGAFASTGGDDAREATRRLEMTTRVITASPALLARERQVFAHYTASLARLIAEETGASEDDVEPTVVADALLGVHRALIDFVRRRTLAGSEAPETARATRRQAKRALATLERGLGDYGALGAKKR